MKLGKLPATHDPRDLKFSKYAAPLVVTLPSRFGSGYAFKDWSMLGNDNYGDCVFAGSAHETMLLTKVGAPATAVFDDQSVLSDYSAVTGFDPNDPNTDQGTDMRAAMNYRRRTGVLDAQGVRHKIGAFVALEPGNWTQLMQAIYLFGVCAVGIQFPASAMDQFNAGQIWDVVLGSPIEGGHYIPGVGTTARTKKVTVVTWAARQEMTKAFYQAFNDESYCLLSEEILNSTGTFHGFALSTLKADLAAI